MNHAEIFLTAIATGEVIALILWNRGYENKAMATMAGVAIALTVGCLTAQYWA